MKSKIIIGDTYNNLTIIRELPKRDKYKNKQWLCKCKCGTITKVSTHSLLSGHTKSCGCLHTEYLIKSKTKHGLINTALYQKWLDIKKRCYNANSKDYKNYGARGIILCEEWYNNFKAFYDWAIENGYEEHLKQYGSRNTTIDRINVNGNYEPSNCRWATQKEQANNRRQKTNRHISNI